MDIALSLQERLSQQLTLSPQMLQSIRILNLDVVDLHAYVLEEIEKNPLILFPASWEPRSCGSGLIENITRAKAPSLRDELRFQLHVSCLDHSDIPYGEYIIDCVDERGYLSESADDLANQLHVPIDRINRIIGLIQTFEPAGVCASTIQECLAIQLQALHKDNACVMAVVNHHLEDLARNRIDLIAKVTGFSKDQIYEAMQIIQSLSLYPGDHIGDEPIRTIVPEILVSINSDTVTVQLTNELPTIQIDETCASLKEDDEEAAKYIQDELSRAKWLAHCISQRSSTLLQVATAIIRHQRSHFLNATPPLPLTLDTVAAELSIHPSTVSRAISDRYYEFARHVLPFKSLFPSKIKSGESDAMIKEEIKRLILSEDKHSPLSDQQISDILKARQMTVARRTVAKYRMEMDIEPACRRK